MHSKDTELHSWREAFYTYTRPRVIGMVFLGFSAGLPFLLVFSTLSAWLTEAGVTRTTIGFFSWIGITYSIKFFWAPVIDRVPLPVLTGLLGKRRSWMLASQLLIAVSLFAMSVTDPAENLKLLAAYALLVAFGSATQDITIDAYRIEAMDKIYQGAMAATYVLGYRFAILVSGAGALYIADYNNWTVAYQAMSCLMLTGMVTTLLISEPRHISEKNTGELEQALEQKFGVNTADSVVQRFGKWLIDAVISPFVEFFKRTGWLAIVILLLIGCFRISDITMGVMANPFYLDTGFSKSEIASVAKVFGIVMTIFGGILGGLVVIRYGLLRPLLVGAVIVPLTNLLFIWLASTSPDIVKLAVVISADNLSGGFASTVFIAYLSSLTNSRYTATQYALFSSIMTLPGKVIGGFAGIVVDSVGYAWFFLYAGLIGLPAILLVIYLMRTRLSHAG